MKKIYTGLKAEVIDFGAYDVVTVGSLPGNCIRVVANLEAEETGKCQNDEDTQTKIYFGNRPAWMQ